MQGQLLNQFVSVRIKTMCAASRQLMEFSVDSDLQVEVRSRGAEPMAFLPEVDWNTFREPNILHAY